MSHKDEMATVELIDRATGQTLAKREIELPEGFIERYIEHIESGQECYDYVRLLNALWGDITKDLTQEQNAEILRRCKNAKTNEDVEAVALYAWRLLWEKRGWLPAVTSN